MVDQKIWKPLNNPDLSLLNSISNTIYQLEWKNPGSITSVRRGPALIITSDYGGYVSLSKYESISFLIADLAFCWLWDRFRKEIRERYLKDSRTISYKRLGERRRRKALIPFLRVANCIPGMLFTFLIDKSLLNKIYEPQPKGENSQIGNLSKWKKKSFNKLTRVGHIGAMLIACMSAPGQEILWFSDKDEIAPNDIKVIEANKIIAHLLGHYLPHDIKKIRFGTSKCDDGSLFLKDLLALPDLAAGAISNAISNNVREYNQKPGKILIPLTDNTNWKSHTILSWYAEQTHPLKKIIVILDSNESGLSTKIFNIFPDSQSSLFDWRPQFDSLLEDRIVIHK